MKLIDCWIELPVKAVDNTFTYICEEEVERGSRVEISFGKNKLVGFVESVHEVAETREEYEKRVGYKLKEVDRVIDNYPIINDELHDLAMWMKEETLSTTISCFMAMLPSKIKPTLKGDKKVVSVKYVKLSDRSVKLTPKQLVAYEYVRNNQPLTYHDLRVKYPSMAHKLIDNEAIITYEKEREAAIDELNLNNQPLSLTPYQQAAKDEIVNSNDSIFLLKGVTGSGKTEIYLQLAQKALEENKQVLILVPEISLTPQMIERVKNRFGNNLAMYHSGLNNQEKYEQYQLIANNKAKIVVGTRSAIFLPFNHLGLIVMDEEHDQSYKQDNQPCYHCRDVAIWRSKYHHCKLVMASATPSLYSYARAIKHVYHLVKLDKRVNDSMPTIELINMREAIMKGQSSILSDDLKKKIQIRLDNHEQVILLLNKRGYHSLLRCKDCGEPIVCPHCDIAMSYHRDIKKMKCHVCGYEMKVPYTCPTCNSRSGFTTMGFGTEKLEEELHHSFNGVRTLRMDADTTKLKNSHYKILNAFAGGEADILLGTQMIAKGLDFDNVTLVGILNGDDGLARSNYLSCETTFDLLMQASGRSGRSDKKGEVVMQVYNPNHYVVQCALHSDYNAFVKYEMNYRHLASYPPYTYLISLMVVGLRPNYVDKLALEIKNKIHGDFLVIGVTELPKLSDLYRSRVILKGKNLDLMREAVRKFMSECEMDLSGLRIDINPLNLN